MRLERSYQKNFGENPFFNLVRSINENISIYLRCIKIYQYQELQPSRFLLDLQFAF